MYLKIRYLSPRLLVAALVAAALAFASVGASAQSAQAPVLIGHWRFDTAAKDAFPDRTGMNPAARYVTATKPAKLPVFAPAPLEDVTQAVVLAGSTDQWIRAPFSSLNKLSAFTIELWINWEGDTAVDPEIKQQLLIGNIGGVIFSIKRGGLVSAMLAGRTDGKVSWVYAEAPERIAAGEWNHLLLRYVDGAIQIGFEGRGWNTGKVLASPLKKIPGTSKYNWSETVLGLNPAAGRSSPFKGQIAAVKLHDGVLDDAAFLASRP
jgi:hypothetical protein